MTTPVGVTVEKRIRRMLPDHVVDAKSALRPEALKLTFAGFRVAARPGSLTRASWATENRAPRPHRRFKPRVGPAQAPPPGTSPQTLPARPAALGAAAATRARRPREGGRARGPAATPPTRAPAPAAPPPPPPPPPPPRGRGRPPPARGRSGRWGPA